MCTICSICTICNMCVVSVLYAVHVWYLWCIQNTCSICAACSTCVVFVLCVVLFCVWYPHGVIGVSNVTHVRWSCHKQSLLSSCRACSEGGQWVILSGVLRLPVVAGHVSGVLRCVVVFCQLIEFVV